MAAYQNKLVLMILLPPMYLNPGLLMADIKFPTAQKNALVEKLQRYMRDELECDLGQFDGEFLLDFISKEFGNIYYNQGLYDAQTVLNEQLDTITDAINSLLNTAFKPVKLYFTTRIVYAS